MNEEQKQEISLFRFGVIADLVGGIRLEKKDKARLIKEQTEKKWNIPFSSKTSISESTILRWITEYQAGGRRLETLQPKNRSDRGKSRSIDEETGLALLAIKREFPSTPADILIKKIQGRNLVSPGIDLYPSTVYRFLNQNGAFEQREYSQFYQNFV